ncbi:RNA 3'-terminal phosphate cyclase [Methanonatronarchaeum sp. AMET-Sl]|uniref:RNA 3'-terminal phosphate cyclase n=1 Tax=Methanonatronarchaeum sp. AMET-Sl TaxID=3037654 RepID=UPI00244DBB43|nr:RNA 3'-terminal phosphate cyclase [Methanonatronarchaeum sp. AMET-Sl]WGI17539.1 RNA 3'-terminal phosphate cyclase [Methanonatronarchaeum sp. AMET-Sl]
MEIDGSYGEGGGQVVRTSLALSSVFGEPIKLMNIRAGRSNPGLSYQHLSCVKLMKRLTNAEVNGDRLRSTELFFKPTEKPGGDIEIDIGTAGSITLLLQCLLPTLHVSNEIRVYAVGGTDVKWSPPIDYLINVTKPILSKYGLEFDLDLIKRGYYPKGGGEVRFTASNSDLNPFDIDCERPQKIMGISHCGNLPRHIAERQANSAEKQLKKLDIPIEIKVEQTTDVMGKGSGIVLWSTEGCRYGSSALGEPGKPAEKVGKEAGEKLIKQIKEIGAVDKYSGDQILPIVGLSGGSYTTTKLTTHTKTNAWLVNQFIGNKKIKIQENKNQPPKITA